MSARLFQRLPVGHHVWHHSNDFKLLITLIVFNVKVVVVKAIFT